MKIQYLKNIVPSMLKSFVKVGNSLKNLIVTIPGIQRMSHLCRLWPNCCGDEVVYFGNDPGTELEWVWGGYLF